MKRLVGAVAMAAVVLLNAGPGGATIGGDPRAPYRAVRGNLYGEAGWSNDPGPTPAADSVDPRSNSLAFNGGDYLAFWGYWHDPAHHRTRTAADAQLKLSWKGTLLDGSPRINMFLADVTGAYSGEVLFLDPATCSGPANRKGWSTADFQKAGSSCTIVDSAGVAHTGTDATPGADLVWGTADDVAATRAMDAALAGKAGQYLYFAYILDDNPMGSPTVLLDRITFAGNVLTKFR